MKPENQNY